MSTIGEVWRKQQPPKSIDWYADTLSNIRAFVLSNPTAQSININMPGKYQTKEHTDKLKEILAKEELGCHITDSFYVVYVFPL